ncbi:LOW QUALITY PROTEIN: rho guanine nucleotide exchange factor 28-like [Daphnia carinata]|uniref:LOW QUALITY PROTEIN: rho guanine nucleotide exchange factor 28-like n=1 Tax=Daphnia carinata TaxID=120202 RepID=UPI00257F542A|nr:LOW QUALITY PROTEIN: rho guanine nucleotide exchange factor 28-like [Daphnia carinata]
MAHYIEQEDYTSTEESGAEDSDEDIITDYLSPLDDNGNLDAACATRILSPGAASAATSATTLSSRCFFDSDDTTDSPAVRISAEMEAAGAAAACDGTTRTISSDDPIISANHYATTAESIPIISVTQHSPAASKAFFILEDNLRQLHGIQESIQRMRQVSVQTLRLQSQVGRRLRYGGSCNWSLSCPSLCSGSGGQLSSSSPALAGNGNGNNNEADWLGATLADWDSPTPPVAHLWGGDGGGASRKASLANGSKRRRSWASPWEVDEMGLAAAGGTCGITYEEGAGMLEGGGGRTRSISLSSGDTDNEQEGGHSSRARQAGIATSSTALSSSELKVLAGRHSTHSLNDMGFPLIPALPTKQRGMSKDGDSRDGDPTKWLSPRIMTLQKSISTPSILAVKDGSNLSALTLSSVKNSMSSSSASAGSASGSMTATVGSASVASGTAIKEAQGILMTTTSAGPTSSFPRMSSYTGLESETDDDSELHLDHHHQSSRYSLGSFVAEPGFENDDDANSSKRRKRGSIFFRKRKDKEKEKSKLKQPHQFVPVCHSNSQPCDVCSKSLTNKAALRCESCAITVHENSCRDQVTDCTRFKVPKSIPLGSKVSSLANLTGTGHTKLQSSHSSVGVGGGGGPLTAFNSSSTSSSLYYSASSSSAATSAGLSGNNHVGNNSGGGGSTWSVASTLPSSSSSTAAASTPASSSQTPSTPIASPLFGNSAVSKLSGLSQRSQWKRVAAKLGVNKCGAGADKDSNDPSNTLNEDQSSHPTNDGDGHDTIEGVFNAADIKDLDLDPELGILDEEAEAWVGTVDKKISKKLKEKEIKRQEHIYEFIITEKHHCLTLKVMQKIFAEGMRREMSFTSETVDRIFPCLEELIEYHLQFLRRLRHRQRQEAVVTTIEDILRIQFSGMLGDQLRSLYGEFCSRHQEAVSMYKEMIKEDHKLAAFARQCTMNPLCKKKDIPECILFVTQRITKYPLLIDPLIKTSREQPDECLKLQQVLGFVKDILIGVNAQVAEKERKLRLIEVYNKIDAKSATTYKNKKFKKSDLLSSNRRLMFEGVAYLNHARGKVQLVTVVVLSDVVFFLQESNQKFHFVTQDNKAGVISLQKLLVREKAGGSDTRSIYLISSNPDEPEMYELQCQNPREKRIWIDTIRAAVEQCPEDEEGNVSEGEEQRKIREAQDIKTRQLIGTLRDKDRQLGALLEEKMATFCELVELLANNEDSTSSWLLLGSDSAPPKYSHLVEQGFQSVQAKETLSQAMTELCRLMGLLLSSNVAANWNLSRSVSSVGERHSDTFSMPLLPKRAETFGGFDQNGKEKGCVKKKSATDLTAVEMGGEQQQTSWSSQIPPVLQLNGEQQAMGLELVHNVSTLLCLLSSQATAFESLRSDFLAEIKASRNGAALSSAPFGSGPATLAKFQHKASHNQRLEELRNLQDRLSKEKAEWSRERAMQEEHLSEQRKQLLKLQEQVRIENTDIQQQRENLYQKLEALRGQGILLSPNMTIVSTAPIASAVSPTSGEDTDVTSASSPPPPVAPANATSLLPSPTPSSVDLGRRKTISGGSNTAGMGSASAGLLKRESCSNLPLPMNLISAKNEQKAVVALANTLPIKQQLPMKLAKLGASMGSTGHASGTAGSANNGNTSNHSPHGNVASPTGGSLVQQLLPLRLSESLEHKRAVSKILSTDSFKPKLSSSSFSPPASKSEDFVAGHNRTGSSPASIQMLSPRHHHYHYSTATASGGGNMNPPKIPDKPASLLLQQAARGSPQLPPPPHGHHHQVQPPPKVHDPETNQEIVFL